MQVRRESRWIIIKNIIDISVELSPHTIIYPGDPTPEYGLLFSLDNNEIANVGYIKTGIHHGTHVDVPYHFKNGERTFEQIPMEHWIGKVLVVDATSSEKCIRDEDLRKIPLKKYKRILFKTRNSTDYYKLPEFYPQFIYLDKSACELMVKSGIKTVGIDYITVDPHGSEDFPHIGHFFLMVFALLNV
ncbi:MAG: cyclase family protein [Actinobacteria bacterium]|nr:cyclase family protein [Actinomycetota bacterium]